jgi:tetratricopeptide (TPR) repeat protein
LTRNISVLRKAIGDDDGAARYVETVPRRGYRFIGELETEFEPAALSVRPIPPVTEAVPVPHTQPVVPPVAAVRAGLLYSPWGSAAIFLMLLAALAVATWHRGEPSVRARYVHPDVRIGQHLLSRLSPAASERARGYFEKALAADQNLAEAHAGLSLVYAQMAGFGMVAPAEAAEAASTAAEQAMRLDSSSGYAHLASAVATMLRKGDLRRAEESFQKALLHDGTTIPANYYYSYLKQAQGDPAGAQRLVEGAMHLDPVSPALGTQYAVSFYQQRDFERAVAECRRVLDREPHFGLAHYYLALSLGHLGRFVEAEQHLSRSGLRPGVIATDLAWLKARQGDLRPARAALAEQRRLIAAGDVDSGVKILMTITLGLNDEAMEAIEATVAQRSSGMMTLLAEPRLDPVRRDPRFGELLRKAGLSPRGS